MSELSGLAHTIKRCHRCRLGSERTNAVPGEGPSRARIMFIGEAPGREEDSTGLPFVGAAGKVFDSLLKGAGLERKNVFITSIIKCRPPKNRKPKSDEISACRPYLVRQIDAIRPLVLVTLGQYSLLSLTGRRLMVSDARKCGFLYHNIPLVSTYHPAAVLYNRKLTRTILGDYLKAIELEKITRSRVGGLRPRIGKRYLTHKSAGCVPYRRDGRFLLIRRMDEGLWCFPKGTVDRGESLEQAALRELGEETGQRGEIRYNLGDVFYEFYNPKTGSNVRKTVTYFLVKAHPTKMHLERGFEDARWCTYSTANKLLHYTNDKRTLTKAREVIRKLARE